MSNVSESHPRMPGQPPRSCGCVVFLIDEAASMNVRVPEGTKSKAESVATALNSLLSQLTAGPNVDVAVVGYRGDASRQADVGCRWAGPLSGSRWVATARLADAPLAVETRVRRIPAAGPAGSAREETVQFPIWYAPRLGSAGCRAAGLEFCAALVSEWQSAAESSRPALVVHVLGEIAGEDPLEPAAAKLVQCQQTAGPPLLVHAHLASLPRIPPTLYPSNGAHLPGPVRDLFAVASVLPDPLAASLRHNQVAINSGARGLIYNGKVADLIRLFSLVRAYASSCVPAAAPEPQPQPAAESEPARAASAAPVSVATNAAAPGERAALLVLVLDRSSEDPRSEEHRTWRRLQEQANELLAKIAQRGRGPIWCCVISYGAGTAGEPEVAVAVPAAGGGFVRDSELAAAMLREDEVSEQVSNGIGGLISVRRKRPVFVDLKPAGAISPVPAFQAVSELAARWQQDHPALSATPVVLHLTRGRFDADQMREAVGALRPSDAAQAAPILHHLVLTESPCRSLAYPVDASRIDSPALKQLWELSSPLLAGRQLAAGRPAISAESRGMVINGKFDLLIEALETHLRSAEE